MADVVRIGRVSKINYDTGMIEATYPQYDNSVTPEFPVISFNDEYKMPKIGDEVMAIHLPTGQARGLVFGHYWNKTNKPLNYGAKLYRKEFGHEYGEAYAEYEDGGELLLFAPEIEFQTSSGTITVTEIITKLADLEHRVSVLEGYH